MPFVCVQSVHTSGHFTYVLLCPAGERSQGGRHGMERGWQQWLRPVLIAAILVVGVKVVLQSASTLQQYGSTAVNVPAARSGGAAGSSSSGGRSSSSTAAPAANPVPSLVEAFLASPLPPRNLNLSEDAPLFFFHQRKTAGSSMRKAIVEAAKAANLSYFVSCHNGVPCDLYHVGTNFSAIYAGHFVWGEQRELSRRSVFDPATGTWHNPRHNASCLTMFRDPVSRLESCYYYRFVQVG